MRPSRALPLLLPLFFSLCACDVSESPADRSEASAAVPAATELPALDGARAAELARLAMDNIPRAYPYKPGFVHVDEASARPPREVHPVFWGSFDWHSSVHGHWMLVRLLKLHPEHAEAEASRALLEAQLTEAGLAAEAAFFDEKQNRSFERMYGWAWLFRLAAELEGWDDPQGAAWREHLRPLETRLADLTVDYLGRLQWPIRTGVHPDTGFALSLALDYARKVGNTALEGAVVDAAKRYYGGDQGYDGRFEPSGEDFFSTSLNEADLMRRVLAPDAYADWLTGYLPGLAKQQAGNLLTPVEVSDVTDARIVHLAGLDLSRGWTLSGIASALPEDDPRYAICRAAATAHAEAGLRYVFSGHYEGEHWLASFAVYLLGGSGIAATD